MTATPPTTHSPTRSPICLGATSTGTVTITLTGVNDGPVAADDMDATDEDTLLAASVLGNDSDVDEDDVLGTNVTVTSFDATIRWVPRCL